MIEPGKWKKASFSSATGNNCVEVTGGLAGGVFVRDSKDRRAMLRFTPAEWEAFVAGVKAGEFDLPGSGT